MGIFDETAARMVDIIQAGEKKATEALNVQRIKMDINRVNKALDETYGKIGRTVYQNKGKGECPDLSKEFERIERLNKEAKRLAEELALAKGGKRCGECGAFNEKDAAFCSRCGKTI